MSNLPEVAIYARLSLEDRDVLKRNSSSINNQIEICKRYIIEHNMILKEIYIDDGVSGTTYDRPGFNALLEGVKRKLFNAIIAKDLSRLGRDFLKSSYYIEEFFPDHAIRFISINDSYDSFSSTDGEMLIAISNYLNGYYAKECRKKTEAYLNSVVNKESLSWSGYYGYVVKNKVTTIDPHASRVVRKIFKMKIEGMHKTDIARYLTRTKHLTPLEYKKMWKGKEYKLREWTDSMVFDILYNPIYTGDAYNFARRNNKRIAIKDRIVVKDTHPAIISKKIYELAHANDVNFKGKGDKASFERLDKFFFTEEGYTLCAERNTTYKKGSNGKRIPFLRHYYRTRKNHYLFTIKFAHKALHAMALDVIHEIKFDSDAFFERALFIYNKEKGVITNKSLYIRERNELNDKYQKIFEESVSKNYSKQEFDEKVEALYNRIREIDELLYKYNELEYQEKDYRNKLTAFINKIEDIDESLPRVDLIKAVYKRCTVIKKDYMDVTFLPELNV